MFTCIFPTQKYQGFRPDRVCFRMARHVCSGVRHVVNDDFTKQVLMQRWTRELVQPIPVCTPYGYISMQLYFPTIRKIFTAMQYACANPSLDTAKAYTLTFACALPADCRACKSFPRVLHAELFIIKCMSTILSEKQRYEAYTFYELCKNGPISWPGGHWPPTLSILDTLGSEKVVLIWFQV